MSEERSHRFTPVRVVVLVAVLSGLFVAITPPRSNPEPAAAATNPWNGPLVPASGVLFGAWIRSPGSTQTSTKATITARETSLGRKLAIDHHFYSFYDTFPSWREPWDIANGRIPLIAWNGTTTSKIVNGSQDTLIRTRARAVKALGAPVFIRFFWEPEAKDEMIGSTSEYINAWRRVRTIFDSEGATNVTWAWCGTAWGMQSGPEGTEYRFYPGDAYVDWVCTDGYNWSPGRPGDEWRDWTWIMQGTHDFAVAHNKPVLIAEFALQERNAGEKAAWMRNAQAVIKTSFPNIKAIVYFDEDRIYDWRVNTSTSSYAAYKAWMLDPFYQATPGGTTPPSAALLEDDFEDGNISNWTSLGATIATTTSGKSLKLKATAGQVWARRSLSLQSFSSKTTLKVSADATVNQAGQVTILSLRDSLGAPLVRVLRAADGALGIQNAKTGATVFSYPSLWMNGTPTMTIVVKIAGTSSSARIELNGNDILSLALISVDLGNLPVGSIELGETGGLSPRKTYSLLYESITVYQI